MVKITASYSGGRPFHSSSEFLWFILKNIQENAVIYIDHNVLQPEASKLQIKNCNSNFLSAI